MSILTLAAAASSTPFWQSSAGGIILGGGITIVTTVVTTAVLQLFAERRTTRREAAAASAAAKAARNAFQTETITELQEEIEAVAAFIGNAFAATRLDKLRTKNSEYMPGLVSFGRVGMLCSRLDDEDMKTRVRAWVRATREYVSTPGATPGDERGVELREERITIIDNLGGLLKGSHQP